MRAAILMAATGAALALAGCGGGGGGGVGSKLVGTFIDAHVSGLEFESSTGSGLTDANGNFTYAEGEHVTFHIGNLYLGSAVPGKNKVTPADLVSGASDARLTRMLRTLQSLDADGDLSNGIQIDASVRATLATQGRIDLDDPATTDEQINALIGAYKVSAAEAQAHFNANKDAPSNQAQGYSAPDTTAALAAAAPSGYSLVAWNDLGMHCVDGKDYSVFSILPPYNNLHAQLVNRNATSGKLVTSNVKLTYEAVADSTGSINTSSAGKTNFWTWVQVLFGANPKPNYGLNLNPGGPSNPTPSKTPAAMAFNGTHGWWEAEGIPIMPYDDKGVKNYYPMVKVVAKDNAGTVLASTKVVLPVSDEMSCKSCHASTSGAAAKPTAGWVNDPDPEKDWKKNILRLHDQKYPNAIADAGMTAAYSAYGTTLLGAALKGKPSLCASCHKSNALATPARTGIKPLTEALHAKHATVKDPTSSLALDDITNRDSCYLCHPGSKTKCLRGAMGNAKNPDGSNAIDCQSCHGNMSKVGQAGREGWLHEPSCQHCHDKDGSGNFVRLTSVFNSSGLLRTVVDSRFASNPNTPMAGVSLYRFSKGHGNLQCESCHGATHAEYPSSHANDNVQSLALQGHVGTLSECSVCHASVPITPDKGPHGMHTVGQAWVSEHGTYAEGSKAAVCKTCHGSDYRGGFLAKTSMARSFKADSTTKSYVAGQQVGCYDCHNGPSGEGH